MARIEDFYDKLGHWADLEPDQISDTVRIGYGDNFLLVEKTTPTGGSGVYVVPHIPEDRLDSFLAWLSGL